MSITPRGMTVQEAYRLYRENRLLVNRKYQRKLVWFLKEKQHLIDSILRGYPIPLILLAEQLDRDGKPYYEIIDGIQRLNAIFGYIEHYFSYGDYYFDINELSRAKQSADSGNFKEVDSGEKRLSRGECANLVDYQLAVTIFPASDEKQITDIFGRINSGGQQLSAQDKRQVGVLTCFSQLVRQVASEIRGDASVLSLPLSQMPEISIEHPQDPQGYGVKADDTIWVKQGIITVKQLRNSEDEQLIADLSASILLNSPIAASQELYDDLYAEDSELSKRVENALATYGMSRLSQEIKTTFSVLKDSIEKYSNDRYALRKQVNPGGTNPIKNIFYSIFMAFYRLVVSEQKTPIDQVHVMEALHNISSRITQSSHYATTEGRENNINITKGLIERYFVHKKPPLLGHGPGLIIDFENSVRRSKIESAKYEFKQGILRLAQERCIDRTLLNRMVNTICGIANCSPSPEGYIFIGLCEGKDVKQIELIDGITPLKLSDHFIVGIEREAIALEKTLDQYIQLIVEHIRGSELCNPLKAQVLSNLDSINYKGLTILRISIPMQNSVSFVGKDAFTRVGSSTEKIEGPDLLALDEQFRSI